MLKLILILFDIQIGVFFSRDLRRRRQPADGESVRRIDSYIARRLGLGSCTGDLANRWVFGEIAEDRAAGSGVVG